MKQAFYPLSLMFWKRIRMQGHLKHLQLLSKTALSKPEWKALKIAIDTLSSINETFLRRV